LSILRRSTAFIVLLGVACLGCCPAWPPNADGVRIASQEVLIYWDAENNMEHFVRRADFNAEELPDDFGFLVPTPSQPKLSEANDELFFRLSDAIKPQVIYKETHRPNFTPLVFGNYYADSIADSAIDSRGSVELLDTAFVGGFQASVLRASDVDALVKWLEDNGYDAREALREWLAPYIEKQWIITAFKFDCDPVARSQSLSREAVCMSFATDQPFFPYRVPTDQLAAPGKGSLLRVYYAGDSRPDANFESGGGNWSATTKFSAEVKNASAMLAGLKSIDNPVTLPAETRLTAFEDKTWPGGTNDLYFTDSDDQSEVRPPPIIRHRRIDFPVPLDLVLVAGLLIFFFVRRRRKNRRVTAA
jgi:hypothetical protein